MQVKKESKKKKIKVMQFGKEEIIVSLLAYNMKHDNQGKNRKESTKT